MSNSWPGGHRHAMSQSDHENWNRSNYPGTLQLCSLCESPTGRCEDDTLWSADEEPLCEDCWEEAEETERRERERDRLEAAADDVRKERQEEPRESER